MNNDLHWNCYADYNIFYVYKSLFSQSLEFDNPIAEQRAVPLVFKTNDGIPLESPGVHENWNNSTDKQYGLNPGTGDGWDI
jgi:hypothetical protein